MHGRIIPKNPGLWNPPHEEDAVISSYEAIVVDQMMLKLRYVHGSSEVIWSNWYAPTASSIAFYLFDRTIKFSDGVHIDVCKLANTQ